MNIATVNQHPKLLLAVDPDMRKTIFSSGDMKRMQKLAEVLNCDPERKADKAFLLEKIPDVEVVVTSWGTAPLDSEVMSAAENLRVLIHAAGSVRPVVSSELWKRKIRVSSCAQAISYGVAEFCLGLILSCTKRVPWFGNSVKEGLWMESSKAFGGAFEIYQQNIGIIGAGHIGRYLVQLLKNFTCNLFVYDPYLEEEEARRLGVEKLESLEEMFKRCRVVSLNAPTNEGTRHMLRGSHFALLPQGALFINTAGSSQIHEEEFLEELRKGRFVACIDRCEVEPVQLDHPFRRLPNVLLTPHIAGVMAENRLRIGTFAVNELESYVTHDVLHYGVDREALARMA